MNHGAKGRISRRVFLAGVAAILINVWQKDDSFATSRTNDGCYWEPEGVSYCEDGTRLERWCYVCCIAGSCHIHYCEWRSAGPC